MPLLVGHGNFPGSLLLVASSFSWVLPHSTSLQLGEKISTPSNPHVSFTKKVLGNPLSPTSSKVLSLVYSLATPSLFLTWLLIQWWMIWGLPFLGFFLYLDIVWSNLGSRWSRPSPLNRLLKLIPWLMACLCFPLCAKRSSLMSSRMDLGFWERPLKISSLFISENLC